MRRRLFWKIYLTLLASLVVVAMLMGGLWWLLGESPHARWEAFRLQVSEDLVAGTGTPGATDETVARLGTAIGADISLYGPDGALIAARGTPITAPAAAPETGLRPHLFTRIELPGGRVALVRLAFPPDQRGLAILTVVLVVAGGAALAAFPMTTRLTRQLERLRQGIARWGEGDAWVRVEVAGSDEVASVARAFNAAAERIAMLLASQRALLANASHELRSPLARLRLATDLWLDDPHPAGRDEIVRNLAELDRLVEEILLQSRLDHPGVAIGRTDRVDLLGLAAEEAARVGASLDGEPVEIDGDETLLRRLLRNLLENAVKHGREPVVIAVTREGASARVVVTDEGDGIPPAERERVFEPFYRPAGHGEAGGGWGLGLSLVRQIASRHGGGVRCEAHPGRGSRFVVTLAALRDTTPVIAADHAAAA